MRYGCICSGVGCASVAWSDLGWEPAFHAEIEDFPSAVLAARFPGVPNFGDFTRIANNGRKHDVDLIVGGTPCQSFSVAGQRAGLDDPRGNLALEYCRLLARLRPRWFIWENVPGVLSSWSDYEDREGDETEEWEAVEESDLAQILQGFIDVGYGIAWRTLDAQYFGVPQRRRRLFVVGYLGDWRPAAAVLFERESLCGDLEEGGEAGESVAALTATGVGTCSADDNQGQAGHLIPEVIAQPVTGCEGKGPDSQASSGNLVVANALTASTGHPGHGSPRGDGSDNLVIAFDETQITHRENRSRPEPGKPCHTLPNQGGPPAIAFHGRQDPDVSGAVTHPLDTDGHTQAIGVTLPGSDGTRTAAEYCDCASALKARPPGSIENSTTTAVQQGMVVRRLTPRECERLQGLPDDWTAITYRGKPAADGPRYRAIGNGMAVPVMRWIGEGIRLVESILQGEEAL